MAAGNSQGAGIVSMLSGTIIDLGPEKMEIDAEIVPGNSGGPVLNLNGEVVGVATYLKRFSVKADSSDWTIAGTRFSEVRRFALRLDVAIDWVKVDHTQYYKQVAYLDDVEMLIKETIPALVHLRTKDKKDRSELWNHKTE